MRVFNKLLKLILVVYVLSIVGEQLMNKYEAGEKFELLDISNLNIKENEPRIIIYGSSHCDFGISAKTIENRTKIKSLNLCNYGIERDKYYEEFLEYLFKNTRKNDFIIYATRLKIKDNPLEEEGILGLLLPQFRTSISSIYRKLIKKNKDFDAHGDRVFYPNFQKEYIIPNYNIDYEIINKELNNKINKIINHPNLKSNIMFSITPILLTNDKLINLNELILNCQNKNNCKKLIGLQLPLLIKNKKLFILAEHLNGNEGRNLWTNSLIKYIKNIL